MPGTIDTHHVTVEIKVAPDPRGGHRLWLHLNGHLAVRVYAADLHLDGVKLVEGKRRRDHRR